jgi:TolB-like protein
LPKRGYRFIASVAEPPVGQERTLPQIQDHAPVSPEMPSSRVRDRWYVVLFGTVLLVGVLLLGLNLGGVRDRLWRQNSSGRAIAIPIQSLAVLPLENLSHDPDQEYFADGLTDALITDLGKVTGLRVISRTSVSSYKKTKKALPQVAHELNVDAIVEGTVLRSGDRVRITAQLVRAAPEEHLWAERYERDTTEVIRLEQQLALAIAHEVSGRLTTAEETRLTSKRTINPQAYDAYLRGRYLWNDRTTGPASGAAVYFEQALRQDPGFALAYSGLADYYSVSWGPWVDLPRAEEYARKAVALEPDLAEGHASLGIAAQYQGKFDDADRELRRAIELNPNYVMAHHWYGLHLLTLGRVTEALGENDRARQLDPFSFPVNFLRASMLMSLHEYDRAVEQLETAMLINPETTAGGDGGPRETLARIYWIEGRGPKALAEEREAAILAHSPAMLHNQDEVDAVYAKAGLSSAQLRAAQVRERACRESLRRSRTLPPASCDIFGIAGQYALLRNTDKALYWLERAAGQRVADRNQLLVISLKSAPEFEYMRSDPRFRALLRRVGLPE